MTTFNLAPLYRSTVGYDRLFDMLGNSIRPDWPPYDIVKKGENEYRITMVVAGFSPEEIELTQDGTSLLIAGQKKADESPQHMLHQGITSRNFKQTFSLAAHVKVMDATLENGLLSIDLVREVPEALKPRQIKIEMGSGKTAQKLNSREIDQSVKEPQRNAA
jgi:molecular chaperone IbpA